MSPTGINCDYAVKKYIQWLNNNVSVRNIAGTCEITTPFLDRHNDCIQIYVEKIGNDFMLTDDGYTIQDLKESGMIISTDKRKKTLQTIINGFGVQINDSDQLVVKATPESIGQKKHNLLQAILSVNDMFVMSEEHVSQFFKEDVAKFLETNEIRFISDFRLSGKSGFDHKFDFNIPKSKQKPERILLAVNRLTRDNATSCLFSLDDVRQVREEKFDSYVFINDQQSSVSNENISALKNYGIKCVLWSDKENFIGELAA